MLWKACSEQLYKQMTEGSFPMKCKYMLFAANVSAKCCIGEFRHELTAMSSCSIFQSKDLRIATAAPYFLIQIVI